MLKAVILHKKLLAHSHIPSRSHFDRPVVPAAPPLHIRVTRVVEEAEERVEDGTTRVRPAIVVETGGDGEEDPGVETLVGVDVYTALLESFVGDGDVAV